jgi:uncharacterized tellurite resistance protein B-like protein
MLDRLLALFGGATDVSERGERQGIDDLHLAAAALMVEAARLDGRFDETERETIHRALCGRFGLAAADAEELIEDATTSAAESTQLYGFSRKIKDRLEPDDRVQIIEMLWEVAYADGHLHDYEANLVRRIAGLLYVPDQESGAARKRVIERLSDAGAVDRPTSETTAQRGKRQRRPK